MEGGSLRPRPLTAAEAAWLAVVPAAVLGVLAIVALGPALGRALLAPGDARFWLIARSLVNPEPVEQGRFLMALAVPLLLAGFTVAGVRLAPRWSRSTIGVLVVAIQTLAVAFVVVCLLQQRQLFGPLYSGGGRTPTLIDYCSVATLLVAAAGTVGVVAAARSSRVGASLPAWTRETRARRVVGVLVALAAIVVWLLHAVYTEDTIGAAYREVRFHISFLLDETFAVLDGRSPLVNFAAQYGSLWPYPFAAGMSLLGDTVGVWVALALGATGLGMLAIFALLRRVAGSSIVGLLLFGPVLAASFFRIGGTLENRYTFGDYFGTFPMRYAGPSILAWLVARHLDGDRPRRPWPLFLAAGLVVLNNADAGIAALGATVAALLWGGGRPARAGSVRIVLEAAAGLAAAFALVSLLTLLRAGALPDLGLLTRYSRLFALAGWGMHTMPPIGLHLVLYLTFVAALGVATVRALRAEPDRLLTGMLAWSGAFGLGAGAYYAGRSTPDDLIAIFFPWSLSLALLLVPALRKLRGDGSWRRPPVAAVACVFGFLLVACSLAQTPAPWGQWDRLERTGAPVLADPGGERFVGQRTRRGEPVALLMQLGHRIGARTGVADVTPYSSVLTMPTAEQLEETIAALREAGGRKVFAASGYVTSDMQAALASAGFAVAARDPGGAIVLWLDRRAR